MIQAFIIQAGNQGSNIVSLADIEMKHVERVKKYMLSIGIVLQCYECDGRHTDFLCRSLLYDLDTNEEIQIKVTSNWRTNLIEGINITSTASATPFLQQMISKHYKTNHVFKLSNPKVLHDFCVIVKKTVQTHVLYFDFATPI